MGLSGISDVKLDPISGKWKLWGAVNNTEPSVGCADTYTPSSGKSIAYVDLGNYAKTTIWPSRNTYGRSSPLAHYVLAPACNCLREFIFYTSTDYACYDVPQWHTTGNPFWGFEITVRRRLDGPPDQ